MPMGFSEDAVRRAMLDLFGDDGSSLDGEAAAPPKEDRLLTPSELGITSGILSDIPALLQVPATDWSSMDLGLSATDRAALAGGGGPARSMGYHLEGGGSNGFSPGSNIAPVAPQVRRTRRKCIRRCNPLPVNLNAGVRPPASSLEDAGRSAPFNMTDQDLANIRDYTNARLRDQAILRGAGTIAADALVPELIAPKIAKEFVPLTIDALNEISEANAESAREKAFQDELWRIMNNRMAQSAMGQNSPAATRDFFIK